MDEMDGIEIVDLTSPHHNEMISDEDFAKRLQMEEYETLSASDFLVAQRLQEEIQLENAARNLPLYFRFGDDESPTDPLHNRNQLQSMSLRPRSLHLHRNHQHHHHHHPPPPPPPAAAAAAAATSAIESDSVPDRVTRLRRAMRNNRTPDDTDGSQPTATMVTDSPEEQDPQAIAPVPAPVPPPVPPRTVRRNCRRPADGPLAFEQQRPRNRYRNGHRVNMWPFMALNRHHEFPFPLQADMFPHRLDLDDTSGNNYDALWELSERIGDAGNKGLTKAEVNRLPIVKYKALDSSDAQVFEAASSRMSTSDEMLSNSATASDMMMSPDDHDCRVCLCSFSNEELLRTLPCCHRFHVPCIDKWITNNAICPVCRDDIRRHVRFTDDVWDA